MLIANVAHADSSFALICAVARLDWLYVQSGTSCLTKFFDDVELLLAAGNECRHCLVLRHQNRSGFLEERLELVVRLSLSTHDEGC